MDVGGVAWEVMWKHNKSEFQRGLIYLLWLVFEQNKYWLSWGYWGFASGFQQFSKVLVAYMRSIHRDVVCEPNWWATWLACSPNMWLTHCSLGLVQKLVCLLVNHA